MMGEVLKYCRLPISALVLSWAAFLLFPTTAYAAQCKNWVAKVHSIQGVVQVRKNIADGDSTSQKKWLPVKLNDTFCKGDILRVQQNSRAALLLNNESVLRLSPNTTITFTDLSADQPSKVDLAEGIAHFISRVRAAFEVITPFLNAAIEGTEFVVMVDPNLKQAEVTVFEGKVRAYNQYGEVKLTANQTALAKQGQAPVLQLKATPRDAVNWSLYYPVIFAATESHNERVDESIAAYRAGQVTTALAKLENEKNLDAASLAWRASLYLSVGDIEQAEKDLIKASSLKPRYSAALAMQAVIRIVQNDKENGLKLAQQAVESDQTSATAKLALSYAQQANFNIDGALATLQQAVKDEKDHSLAWTRLAEVYLMHGELDEALNAAQLANTLNPNTGRTHTVLGFAYLTRIEIKQAIDAFNTAIKKDQTDPLARLGLGLATIRSGDLKNGRREIEYAATLDPNNALIRSYLGKAYYEEKRNDVAATQFEMARALDPNDPTAYFYDAIRKQSENLNVQSLKDMQLAIEKNDNRAVYRSALHLDQDNAAKSVSQAQIYKDVGFEIEAQNLAYQSLQTDHGNHMAHRFLAEAYASRPRHEIARVSEALQALLYSPLSHNPVPPHISETDLGTLPNAGPASNSFNTYNSLFERDGSRWDITLIGGNQQTAGDEIVYSVLQDNVAVSLGQYHYQTGGFRPNNDFKQDVYNFFVQSAITPNHSFQMEVKKSETESGDLRLRFDPDTFTANRRETDTTESLRLGHNWKLGSSSNLVTSLILIDRDFYRQSHSLVAAGAGPGGADIILEDDRDEVHSGHIFESQYLYKHQSFSSLFGLGNYDEVLDSDRIFQLTANGTVLTGGRTRTTSHTQHTNAYWYNYLDLKPVQITLGFSNDDYDLSNSIGSSNQANYKFGFQIYITDNLLLRTARFRTLTRSLTTSQTIEPTHISGFNQFYEDQTATDAVNSAIGMDFVGRSIKSGVEVVRRKLLIPGVSNNNRIVEGQNENIYHAYNHYIFSNQLTAGLEWHYEEFDKEVTTTIANNQPGQLKTSKFPVFVAGNIHRFSGKFSMTYYDQDVATPDNNQRFSVEHDSFWIGDLNLDYKFTKRTGVISLNVSNVFEQEFKYYDSTFRTVTARAPELSHDRTYTISLNLPID